ncbi:helix-turn-helix domain-containing protein [Pseudomonas sp. D1-3]
MGIGDRLKEERQRLGLNQSDFAALAGVAKNSQLNYEKGERSPDAEYLAAIAEKGVDVLYVIAGRRTPAAADAISEAEADLLEHFRLLPEGEQGYTRTMIAALAEKAGR